MKGKLSLHWGCALGLLLVTGLGARADYYYNFSPVGDPTIYSDNAGMGIVLAQQPNIGPIATNQNTNVVAATMTTFINQGVTGTDTFTSKSTTLSLTIVDGTDHASTTFGLTFSGSLSAETSQIKVAFTGPTTQVLTVGGNQYSITLSSIVPPGIPNAIPGSVGGEILAGINVNGAAATITRRSLPPWFWLAWVCPFWAWPAGGKAGASNVTFLPSPPAGLGGQAPAELLSASSAGPSPSQTRRGRGEKEIALSTTCDRT